MTSRSLIFMTEGRLSVLSASSSMEQGQWNSCSYLAAGISQPAMLMQDVTSSRVDNSRYLFDSKFRALVLYLFTQQNTRAIWLLS